VVLGEFDGFIVALSNVAFSSRGKCLIAAIID
jgi:hypothetical protein